MAKLSPGRNALVWATFLGGSGTNPRMPSRSAREALCTWRADGVGRSAGNSGVVQGTYGGGTDAFVASLSADGTSFDLSPTWEGAGATRWHR